jgi:hypothetical protein
MRDAIERTSFVDITTADAPEQGARSDGSSRRRLLTAGLSGAALAALVSRPAAAASDEATTTTAPPKQPTSDDVQLLVFAQRAELAAQELYTAALDADQESPIFDDLSRATMASIRQHHDAYAEALGGLLGRDSIRESEQSIVDSLSADFTGSDAAAIAVAAHGLEQTLVATHTELLGALDGIDGSALIASILVVEARHIPVLATLAGLDAVDDIALFVDNDATPLTPADPA